ncbi:MAG: UbiX family flavin prenyltransferase [Oscillospiraceae bacterium]
MGIAVVPCSMKTLAGIASGYSENLLLRAADVTLKEGRKLVLAVREAPLSAVHLRNMYELARFGAVVFPPVPAWYAKPQSLEEAERQIAARILAQFGVEAPGAPCWG